MRENKNSEMKRPNMEPQAATVASPQMPGQNVKYKKRTRKEKKRKEIEN